MVQKMCFAERKYGFFFFLLSRYQCSIYLPLLSRPGRIKHQTAVLFRQSFFPIVLLLCTYLYFFLFFLIRDWCVEGSFLQQQKGISVTTVVESKPESSSRKRRSSCSREDSHLSFGNFPLSILLSWGWTLLWQKRNAGILQHFTSPLGKSYPKYVLVSSIFVEQHLV